MPVCDDTFAVLKADEDKCVVFVACLPPVEYFPEYEAKKNCWFIVHPTKDLFACLFEIGAERTMHCSYDVFDFKPHELEAVSRQAQQVYMFHARNAGVTIFCLPASLA